MTANYFNPVQSVYGQGALLSLPKLLAGRKALVVGIANEHSIAYGCAKIMREQGAEVAITYLNDKAEKFVRPLAEGLAAPLILPLDVQADGQLEQVFAAIGETWGQIDFVVHSIAFCPMDDLHGRVTDCSRDGFLQAMRVSCYSFIEMARLAEPLMKNGGALSGWSMRYQVWPSTRARNITATSATLLKRRRARFTAGCPQGRRGRAGTSRPPTPRRPDPIAGKRQS